MPCRVWSTAHSSRLNDVFRPHGYLLHPDRFPRINGGQAVRQVSERRGRRSAGAEMARVRRLGTRARSHGCAWVLQASHSAAGSLQGTGQGVDQGPSLIRDRFQSPASPSRRGQRRTLRTCCGRHGHRPARAEQAGAPDGTSAGSRTIRPHAAGSRNSPEAGRTVVPEAERVLGHNRRIGRAARSVAGTSVPTLSAPMPRLPGGVLAEAVRRLRSAQAHPQVSVVDLRDGQQTAPLAAGPVDAILTWNPPALVVGGRAARYRPPSCAA